MLQRLQRDAAAVNPLRVIVCVYGADDNTSTGAVLLLIIVIT